MAGLAMAGLVACGGAADRPDNPAGAGLSTEVVMVQGTPVTVTWRADATVEAQARAAFPPDDPVSNAAEAIRTATGCTPATAGLDYGRALFFESDGTLSLTLPVTCGGGGSPTVGSSGQNRADSAMAAAVERAVRTVVNETPRPGSNRRPARTAAEAQPSPAPTVARPAAAPAPQIARTTPQATATQASLPAPAPQQMPDLYEGSPYAAFTPEMLRRFCAETWTTRVAPNGRTEYNPCTERDAFL